MTFEELLELANTSPESIEGGICANVSKDDAHYLYKHSPEWRHYSGSYGFPIHGGVSAFDNQDVELWKGKQLSARIDLLEFLILHKDRN